MIHAGRTIKNFQTTEFSENILLFGDPELSFRLQKQRNIIGFPIYPSMAKGALARFEGTSKTSKHYAVKRLSTAIDWFSGLPPFQTWNLAISSGLWDGIGIYFDTRNNYGKYQVMFHTDFGRDNKVFWLRRYSEEEKKPIYLSNIKDGSTFWYELFYNFNLCKKSKNV